MSPTRATFATICLFFAARFIVTPTWPCAFVVAVSLTIALAFEVACAYAAAQVDEAQAEAAAKFDERLALAEAGVANNDAALQETRARVDSLAGRRAFGG